MNQVIVYWYEGGLFHSIEEVNETCVRRSIELLEAKNRLSSEYIVAELTRLTSAVTYIRKVKAYEYKGRLYETKKQLVQEEFYNLTPDDVLSLI